jgi:hypothetical protein
MVAMERLVAEYEVASRIAQTATDAKTATELRRYLQDLEDRMRTAPIGSAGVSI